MTDRREAILARLKVVLETISGLQVFRNRGELTEDKRPGIMLFDGDELADERAFDRGRLAKAPNRVKLTPQVYLLLQQRKPDNFEVGSDISNWRILILKAVLLDTSLQTIVGSVGEIHYDGCVTDLGRGRAMDGELGLQFTFTYPLIPSEL